MVKRKRRWRPDKVESAILETCYLSGDIKPGNQTAYKHLHDQGLLDTVKINGEDRWVLSCEGAYYMSTTEGHDAIDEQAAWLDRMAANERVR